MKKLYYIGYYSDFKSERNRKTAPAADTKMDYIVSTLNKLGYAVEVLSFCIDDDRKSVLKKKPGYKTTIKGTRVTYFTNYASKFRCIRVLGRFISWLKIKRYLCKNCMGEDSQILIYHSLGLLKVLNLFEKKKKKFVLEMEEIYADVIGKKSLRDKEISVARKASAYIFPTKLLDAEINVEHRPFVIVHGTYQVEKDRRCNVFKDNIQGMTDKVVHCVYAGTFDPRKGGALAAVSATAFLPSQYWIHVLGFGSDEEIRNMKKHILEIDEKSKAHVSYDGLLSGEEYIRFIQSCDIGLSTQNPDAAFNATSFPSKILSYLSNGLRVVSIRIPAIEGSDVGDKLFYYDEQTPKQIADAILSVDMAQAYDSRSDIVDLSNKFQNELMLMMKEY